VEYIEKVSVTSQKMVLIMIINNKVLELGIDWLFNAAITDHKGKLKKKKKRVLFT